MQGKSWVDDMEDSLSESDNAKILKEAYDSVYSLNSAHSIERRDGIRAYNNVIIDRIEIISDGRVNLKNAEKRIEDALKIRDFMNAMGSFVHELHAACAEIVAGMSSRPKIDAEIRALLRTHAYMFFDALDHAVHDGATLSKFFSKIRQLGGKID